LAECDQQEKEKNRGFEDFNKSGILMTEVKIVDYGIVSIGFFRERRRKEIGDWKT